jgi:pimeloyl-ACP methyl ester carboxylesterase/DNA-binding CsgD family transcriptional regulator
MKSNVVPMNEEEYANALYRGPNGAPSTTLGQRRRAPDPVIQYARTSDGVNIAYYAIGDGPPLVYLTPGSHLEREWQYPEQRAWLERLAARFRLVRLDSRGSGLSDRDREFELDKIPLDVEAVVSREGLKRFALVGNLSAAAMATLYANCSPKKVSHLILWCPYDQDSIDSSPPLRAVRAGVTKDWPTFTQVLSELLTGWADMDQARRYATYINACMHADQFLRFSARFTQLDLMQALSQLTMPVLVLQRKDAVFPTVESARKVAANVSDARLVLLEGSSAVPFLGDTDAVLSAILELLSKPGGPRPLGLTERQLEILALLASGSSNKQIANALSLSIRTVDRHIFNIYQKIGAHNRVEAVAYAYQQGITALT